MISGDEGGKMKLEFCFASNDVAGEFSEMDISCRKRSFGIGFFPERAEDFFFTPQTFAFLFGPKVVMALRFRGFLRPPLVSES